MLVVLTETYCNKVNIQITQRDEFIQIDISLFSQERACSMELLILWIVTKFHIFYFLNLR